MRAPGFWTRGDGGWAGDARNAFTGEGLDEGEVEAQAYLPSAERAGE